MKSILFVFFNTYRCISLPKKHEVMTQKLILDTLVSTVPLGTLWLNRKHIDIVIVIP